jgi:hypothetical protein
MRERALVEAVVVADAFAWAGKLQLPWLDAYVADRQGWPGVIQLRRAVDLSSHYARSPGETRVRMIIVLGGLPEPLINPPVWSGTPAVLVAHPDLLLFNTPRVVGVEYDGAYHDNADQRAADNRRENRLAVMADLPLLRYGAADVLHQRSRVLGEIAQFAGWRDTLELDDRDFRRPPQPLGW